MKLLELLAEALKPSQYRSLVKSWDKSRYADIFDKYPHAHHSRNKFRIYIPLKTPEHPPKSKIEPLISQKISSKGYTIKDYKQGIASNGKREMKIGKLIADDPQLTKQFTNDPVRAAKTLDLIVAISRHPYDIAGMSTNRGKAWTSCMNLINGSNRHYIPLDIEKGTIVAYLIKASDENIKRPLARIAIKPFVNELNPTEVLFGIENKVYGSAPPEFLTTVESWAKQENKEKALEGVFVLHPRLYHDIHKDKDESDHRRNHPIIQISDKEVERQIRQVMHMPAAIEHIKNPSEQVQIAAVKRDGNVIKHINNPSEQIQIAAVKQDGKALFHIKEPSERVQMAALKQDFTIIKNIKNPSEQLLIAAVKHRGYALMSISNPSERVQMAAVERDGKAIFHIKEPSERVQMAAIKQNGDAIQYIDNPSEEWQMVAVRQRPSAITHIGNPSLKVQMATVTQDSGAIFYLPTASDQVRIAAVTQDGLNIMHISNPSEQVQLAAFKQNHKAFYHIKHPSEQLRKMMLAIKQHQ